MRLSVFFLVMLALAITACQTTTDPEVERENRYVEGLGP